MGIIYILLLYGLFAGACMYLVLCVDPNKKGILPWMNRLIYDKFPEVFKKYGGSFLGARIMTVIDKSVNYLCYSNHPIVQVFYVFVTGGGFTMFTYFGLVQYFPHKHFSNIHLVNAALAVFLCFFTFYKASSVGPGVINKGNEKQYIARFKRGYDNVLNYPNNVCQTCQIVKPARSKHCKVCNVCVSRHDHHCVWVKQCIGEENYKWFLAFIGTHAFFCLYGGILGLFLFYYQILDERLLEASFRNYATGEVIRGSWMVIFKYLMYNNTPFMFCIVLAFIMGITLSLFFCYHLSLVSRGVTTNERIKINSLISGYGGEIKRLEQETKSEGYAQLSDKDKQARADTLENYRRALHYLKNKPVEGFKTTVKKIIWPDSFEVD